MRCKIHILRNQPEGGGGGGGIQMICNYVTIAMCKTDYGGGGGGGGVNIVQKVIAYYTNTIM